MWSYLYVGDLPTFVSVSALLTNSLDIIDSYTDADMMAEIQIFLRVDATTGGFHFYFSPAAMQLGNIVGAQPYRESLPALDERELFLSGHSPHRF
ncbi:hypothetical protein [Aeromonas hydrophila]|uniref:hypothetical protein n=1 Tax=Aeromonas hydrophila TaxID=644 RepID=UPI002441B567|nr:hypothetical protein [Aeromonas hydrophila]